jgi:hypothetical protein
MGKREMFLYKGLTLAFPLLCKPVNNYKKGQRIILIHSNDIYAVVDITLPHKP